MEKAARLVTPRSQNTKSKIVNLHLVYLKTNYEFLEFLGKGSFGEVYKG
jgi:hypothetical protein